MMWLLLACGPQPVESVQELAGDWFGTYQVNDAEGEGWTDREIGFEVQTWHAFLDFQSGPDDPAGDFLLTYSGKLSVPRPGHLRIKDVERSLKSYDDDGVLLDEDDGASGQIDLLRVLIEDDTLFLHEWILER